jgi:hypothetical protein
MAVQTKKSGVTKVDTKRKTLISIDLSDEVVLELDRKGEVALSWDPFSFRALKEETIKELSEESRVAYYKAKIEADERAKEAERKAQADLEVMSPLEMNSSHRLKIRARRGWHQAWKAPGVDFDTAMSGPYKQVRKQKEGESEEPGYENGEVLKLYDGEGKVELIAVECPEELYQQHLLAMARKSSRMLVGAKEDFFRATEEINRKQSNRDSRIIATDESSELQA